jgi:hypothetical protein
MMDAQTHRLRNNFILLKNGGKDFDTIVKEMQGVSLKSLKTWDKSYNDEMKKIAEHYSKDVNTKSEPIKHQKKVTELQKKAETNYLSTSIQSINKNGDYIKNNEVKFNVSLKESIINSLILASFPNLSKINDKSLKEELIQLAKESKSNYIILHDQLVNIELNKIEAKDGIQYKTKIQVKDEKQLPNVEKAINFYIANFLFPSEMANKDKLQIDISKYFYNSASEILPIAIKKIIIKKYNGIANLELEELYVDSQWIFITGENGFGKTSFLQALTIGLLEKKIKTRIYFLIRKIQIS